MKKILSVFGTRPEGIKMAPVIKELEKRPDEFESVVCVTGQHRQMLDQVLEIFSIKPCYDLDIMRPDQDLFSITCDILQRIKVVLLAERPDLVLVHGDTTTAFATALSAFYLQIPVGHVEAGLRTYNKYSPWPEEFNRQAVDRLSDIYFAPTELARDCLLAESVPENNVFVTGNTVIDSLLGVSKKIRDDPQLARNLTKCFSFLDARNRMILVTGHRRENFGSSFEAICYAIQQVAQENSNIEIVYPIHLNPHIQEPAHRILGKLKNIHLIKPQDYLSFVWLMNHAYFIVTDSGGIQEEAPSLGKPVLVLRDTTERPEAVEAGTVRLVGADRDNIIAEMTLLLNNSVEYNTMARAHNPYGDGRAAKHIAEILTRRINQNQH